MLLSVLATVAIRASTPAVPTWTVLDVRFEGRTPIVQVRLPDGTKHPFLIDSGSVDTRVAKRLVPEGQDSLQISIPVNGGEYKVVAEADDSAMLQTPDPVHGEDGVIGVDALKHMKVFLDYPAQRCRVSILTEVAPPASVTKGPSSVLRLTENDDGHFTLPATYGSVTFPAVMDTGATVASAPLSTLSLATIVATSKRSIQNWDGSVTRGAHLLRKAKFGGLSLDFVEVTEDEPDDFGAVVGPSMLAPQVLVDLPKGTLTLFNPGLTNTPSAKLSRILSGIPVVVAKDYIGFDPNAGPNENGAVRAVISGARFVAIGTVTAADLLLALDGKSGRKNPADTLGEAFRQSREGGKLTVSILGVQHTREMPKGE